MCEFCGRFFPAHTLFCHIEAKHVYTEKEFQCIVCMKLFKTPRSLKSHMSRDHVSKTQQCEHCGKRFASHSRKEMHVRNIHVPNELCHVCGIYFVSDSYLKSHMEEAHE